MKELIFRKQDNTMGDVEGVLRVKDKICYFKYNQSAQAQVDDGAHSTRVQDSRSARG